MNLPDVRQEQIELMKKNASSKYGVTDNEDQGQDAPVMHPMLAAPEEPIFFENEEVEEPQVQEAVEPDEEESQAPVQQESSKEYNMRLLRERAERAEREREEAMKYIMSLQQGQQQKQTTPTQQEDDFSIAIDDESLVEGKQLKELVKEVKNLRSTLKNYEQKYKKTDEQTLEMRLQNQFPDFHQVVTYDNLAQLRQMNPDLADSILKNEDQYKQAKLAYEMVKQLGIYHDNSVVQQERIIAQKNVAKPKPLSSISPTQGETPLSRVNAFANSPLTKEVQKSLWEEMQQSMKGR